MPSILGARIHSYAISRFCVIIRESVDALSRDDAGQISCDSGKNSARMLSQAFKLTQSYSRPVSSYPHAEKCRMLCTRICSQMISRIHVIIIAILPPLLLLTTMESSTIYRRYEEQERNDCFVTMHASTNSGDAS